MACAKSPKCAKCWATFKRVSCYCLLITYFIFSVTSFIAAFVFQYFYEPPSFNFDLGYSFCKKELYAPVLGLEYNFSQLKGIHVTPSEDNITLYWSVCDTLKSSNINLPSVCYNSYACGVDQYNRANKVAPSSSYPSLYIPPERNTWVKLSMAPTYCSNSITWCDPSVEDVTMFVIFNCDSDANEMVLVDSHKENNTFYVEMNTTIACSQYFGTFPEDEFHIGVFILPFVGLSSCLISFLLAKYRPSTTIDLDVELVDESSRILPIAENIESPQPQKKRHWLIELLLYWLKVAIAPLFWPLVGVASTTIGYLGVIYFSEQYYNSDNPVVNLAARFIPSIIGLQYVFSVFVEAGAITLLQIPLLYLFRKLLQLNGKAVQLTGVRKQMYKTPLKLVSLALTAIIMPYLSHRVLIMITPAFTLDVIRITGSMFIVFLWIAVFSGLLIGIIRIALVFDVTPYDMGQFKEPFDFDKLECDCCVCCRPSPNGMSSHIFWFLILSVKLLFKAFFGTVEYVLVKKTKLYYSIFDFLKLRASTVAFLFVLFPVIGPYLFVIAHMFGSSGIWAREYWGKYGDSTPPWVRYFTCMIYSFIPFTSLIFPNGLPFTLIVITAASVFAIDLGVTLFFHVLIPLIVVSIK